MSQYRCPECGYVFDENKGDEHEGYPPGTEVLELGFGRRSLARHIVELRGARWTGIEPEVEQAPKIGAGGFGHTAAIPFPDATFDLICGIQSFEHWAERRPKC